MKDNNSAIGKHSYHEIFLLQHTEASDQAEFHSQSFELGHALNSRPPSWIGEPRKPGVYPSQSARTKMAAETIGWIYPFPTKNAYSAGYYLGIGRQNQREKWLGKRPPTKSDQFGGYSEGASVSLTRLTSGRAQVSRKSNIRAQTRKHPTQSLSDSRLCSACFPVLVLVCANALMVNTRIQSRPTGPIWHDIRVSGFKFIPVLDQYEVLAAIVLGLGCRVSVEKLETTGVSIRD